MSVISDILPALNNRLSRFEAAAKRLAVKKTGKLIESIKTETDNRQTQLIVKVRYNIYALILYYMAKNGKRQRAKKGGSYKGSRRLQGANELSPDSPLKKNPGKYQLMIEEEREFRDDIEEVALSTILDKAIDVILAPLD